MGGKDKMVVITARVTDDIKEKLENECELQGTTLNSLTSKILTKHVMWDRFAHDIGFVTVTRPFIRALMDEVDEKTIQTIAASMCSDAVSDAILFIEGEMNKDSLVKVLDLWFTASNIPFRHIIISHGDNYIVHHGLGVKWSLYIETVVSTILNKIGCLMKDQKINDHTISFNIVAAK